jgi:hypothetical protein
MALLSIEQNPTITDTIRFDLLTPDADGCPPLNATTSNTYMVNQVVVYFVERDFTVPDSMDTVYPLQHVDPIAEVVAAAAEAVACSSPTDENIAEAKRLRMLADTAISTTDFHYKDTKAIATFGTHDFPAWLRTDPDNSILQPYVDDNGDAVPGRFTLDWTPDGEAREGDYFICWTWTPLLAGDSMSSHQPFYLLGDTQITTALPIHQTVPNKYETLLERYLPEMFKMHLCPGDLTPEVVDNFHSAVAMSFTDIENLVNQIIDLLDANCTYEAFLPYLSNLFNLKLRSPDPTRWRRQIKRAIPLYKQKGTLGGLISALDQAGITLTKFTKMWQIESQYTYTDMFHVSDASELAFELSHVALPLDLNNFSLKYRPQGSSSYMSLDSSYVAFDTVDGVSTMTWIGHTLSYPISLAEGDLLVVMYLIKTVPTGKQSPENYLRSLDLADQRDALDPEGNLIIPLKNWNIHVIEEDDALFDVLIPTRHPYADDVIFGKVRTEFAFSENIYNMDAYNGSKRDSTNPCDIDQDFLDDCSACLSSKFTVDLEIHDISNDKIVEAEEIIGEYSPFHAILHHMNVSGIVEEFVISPVETVDTLVNINQNEYVFAGNANDVFTRYRLNGYDPDSVRRDMLAETETVVSAASGVGYNDSIVLYCPEVRFDRLPISSITVLEVLAPSANAGTYATVQNPGRNTLEVSGVAEPLNQNLFTFRLSNKIYDNPSANIYQDDLFELGDSNINFGDLGVISQWDVDNQNGITASAWTVNIPAYGVFDIADITPSGNLVLSDPSRLLPVVTTTGIGYTVVDDSSVTVASSNTGRLTVQRRGRLKTPDVNVPDIRGLVQVGFYVLYSGTQYRVSGFVGSEVDECYLEGYSGGDAAGVSVAFYHRRVDQEIGYFDYKGMKLDAGTDLEASLGILNGQNAPTDPNLVLDNDHFKENYLILIDNSYYRIEDIDANIVTLVGTMVDYTTLSFGGQTVAYDVIHFTKNSIIIDDQYFDYIDRSGSDLVNIEQVSDVSASSLAMTALNTPPGSSLEEVVSQDESVTFLIQYADGTNMEMNL